MATNFATAEWIKTQFGNFAARVSAVFAKKAELPTKISDLENDSGYITSAATDLANYYLKTETYSKDEVAAFIAAVNTMTLRRVDELPTEDISDTTIYLVPKTGGKAKNVFSEYIYVDGDWELIGETETNLDNYVTSDELAALLEDYIAKTDAETEDIDFSTFFSAAE